MLEQLQRLKKRIEALEDQLEVHRKHEDSLRREAYRYKGSLAKWKRRSKRLEKEIAEVKAVNDELRTLAAERLFVNWENDSVFVLTSTLRRENGR